jgi:hypothetical protein
MPGQEAGASVASATMRPRLAIPALLGLLGALRLLRRRRPGDTVSRGDPAEELRAKLAAAKTVADDRDAFEAGETPVDEAAEPSVDERRRAVHEATRGAIDEIRGS